MVLALPRIVAEDLFSTEARTNQHSLCLVVTVDDDC